jgi:predicted MPP superfamily phosphohydrolase
LTVAAIFILCFVAIVILAYALFIETRMYRVRSVRLQAPCLNGRHLTILHVSDFHFKGKERAKLRFLQQLQREAVDLVFATGDMIDDNTGIPVCVEALSGFKARFGTYAIFGAHDHWDTHLLNVVLDLSVGGYRRGKPNDFERLKKELSAAGVICLENQACRLDLEPGPANDVWVVGVDDMFAGLADFEKAMADVPASSPKILLTHTVENPAELTARGFDVVFAGHSHGGQVRLPLLGAVITRSSLPRKYAWGSFAYDGAVFHINNGLGTGKWTGFRFLCPPEATYVELLGG